MPKFGLTLIQKIILFSTLVIVPLLFALGYWYSGIISGNGTSETLPYFKKEFLYGVFFSALTVFAVLIIMIRIFAVRPVTEFSRIIKAILQGELDRRVDFSSDDEMGRLADSINEMAYRMKEITDSRVTLEQLISAGTEELERYKSRMEEIIKERTKELEEINEKLKKENTYKIFFERSSDAILTLENGVFVDCNESAVKMLKAKNREEVLNTQPWDLSPEFQPDGKSSLEKAREMESLILEGNSIRFEWYHKRMDGEVFPVEVLLTSLDLENKTIFSSVWRDIAERKLAEKKLSEYHEHLEELVGARTAELAESNKKLQLEIGEHERLESDIKQILNASGNAIRVVDDKFNIIYVNAQFVKFSQLSEKELMGRKCYDITPEEGCHTDGCILKRILNGEREITKDVKKHFEAAGREIPCVMTCEPYVDSNGKVVGMVESYRDITERLMAQEMAEKNALQQGRIEMSNNILHDIGNAVVGTGLPLSRLVSDNTWIECRSLENLGVFFTQKKDSLSEALGHEKTNTLIDFSGELLEKLKKRNQSVVELGKRISKSLEHVNLVLNLQRQYTREGVISKGRVNINSLIENALFMQSANFEKRNIDLTFHFEPETSRSIPGDTTRLMQVMLNILKNCCESFDECEDDRKRFMKINAVKAGEQRNYIRLSFEDNAAGISPEMKSKVFDRGFTTKATGTGIGLEQCRSIVNSHSGKIWFESDGIDKGATIFIELPSEKS